MMKLIDYPKSMILDFFSMKEPKVPIEVTIQEESRVSASYAERPFISGHSIQGR